MDESPAKISSNSFPSRSIQMLYVPKGCKSVYKKVSYWRGFKEIIEFDYIDFADVQTKSLCLTNWDMNDEMWM